MDIVVAVDANWSIGYQGTQPFVVPEDRKHFRTVTGTGTVIVGRKTLMDFPGSKPLKNRRNIILTRDEAFCVEGGEVAHSVDEAFELLSPDEETYVIGGDSVYRQLLPYCTRAYITKIEKDLPADAFFPNLDLLPNWTVTDHGEEKMHEGVGYRFMVYENLSPIPLPVV